MLISMQAHYTCGAVNQNCRQIWEQINPTSFGGLNALKTWGAHAKVPNWSGNFQGTFALHQNFTGGGQDKKLP